MYEIDTAVWLHRPGGGHAQPLSLADVPCAKWDSDRGLGLILDYVPNHVAPDHPWLAERPECFVVGTEQDLDQHPEACPRTAAGPERRRSTADEGVRGASIVT